MQPTVLALSTPVNWHGTPVREVRIKPPTTRALFRLGDPRLVVRNADGAAYYVEKEEIIRSYAEEMIDHEGGMDLINMLPFVDGKRVKGAILSFFDQADAAIYAQRSASSSST